MAKTDQCHTNNDASPRQPVPSSEEIFASNQAINFMEEEKPIIPGVTVRAAPIEQLVQLCVECFEENGDLTEDTEYQRVFFLMHKWFLSSDLLAQAFVDLYQNSDDTIICSQSLCQHLALSKNCAIQQYKSRICYAVRYWIRTYPVHFDMDRKLSSAIQDFGNLLQQEGNHSLQQLIDLSKIPSYDWMRNMSIRNPSLRHNRKVSLVFDHLESALLAEQLTYLEYKAFRRINFSDYKHYAIHGSLKDNPRLERSISLFNGLSQWIQCMVLSKITPQQRADILVKFINVAKRLRSLQNFNMLMAVVGGLTHSALARLNKTNACLPADAQKLLMEYTELLSSSNNFSSYRKVFQQCTGFKIPILGVHLKDLILLHTALPDRVDPRNLINFRKMTQLSIIFSDLTRIQNDALPVDPNMDLIKTIKLSLDLHYTEDDIYELSLAREPRNSMSGPSTPTMKPLVFADWVAGVKPPDTKTFNKHVHDMVKAVFKNYDHDRDGFISHAEFDAIAGNFPFIDSFCVLDADQDGKISKSEMKTYFISANYNAIKSSFKHTFHEITYFKPTFCIHCTGLLWGLIKQGWKCRDCGINAHKHCKDVVVMECRSKPQSLSGTRLDLEPNANSSNADLSLSARRRMTQMNQNSSRHSSTQSDTSFDNNNDHHSNLSHTISEETMSTDYSDEQALLYDKLVIADKTREKLMEENAWLQARLDAANDQIQILKGHIGLIRRHTISFILDQMDTLHVQSDTEV